MSPWERRLNDLWLLLERCHTTYMEPELFRLNTNQFLQTARTVTFIIQKNKPTIPGFDAWYQPIVASWCTDSVMSWAKDSRNKIEKEGDLDLHSTLEMNLFWSYLEEQDIRIDVGKSELLRAGLKKLVQFALRNLPPGVADSAAIKIERKWIANSLPKWELLHALTYIYATMYRTCTDLCIHLGTPMESSIPDPTLLYPAREKARKIRYLKLSDLNFHYQHNERIPRDSNFKPAKDLESAITSFCKSVSRADTFDGIFDAIAMMARDTFMRDGYHIPMLFLYDKNMKVVDWISMEYRDQTDKYIFWRTVADRVVNAKAALVLTIGEAWIRDMSGHTFVDAISSLPVKGERLFVDALDYTGKRRCASWDIVRSDKDSKPILRQVGPDAALPENETPFYYAPIFHALGLPYPEHIAKVLRAPH